MNLRDKIIEELKKAHISSPLLESSIILAHAAPNYPQVSQVEKENIANMLQRRIKHEPLDKIIGQREFYKSIFKTSSDVLSPRADTEILVEKALQLILPQKNYHVLDLGTGSGCILLSLLKEYSQIQGTGVDISPQALAIAQENAQNLGLTQQVKFIQADWKKIRWNNSYDMIVSNPPYIPTREIETLETEVKNYDPLIALDGGSDGLKCYHEIAEIVPDIMKKEAYILLEVGYNQADDVADIFVQKGLKIVETVKDLASINRCVILKK